MKQHDSLDLVPPFSSWILWLTGKILQFYPWQKPRMMSGLFAGDYFSELAADND
jgi:hypothetical protein